jgi:CheY-like chemotaxis protein
MKKNYVLCVDDDPDDCALLAEALTQLRPDIELRFVHNAENAMEILRASDKSELPCLIVMDINMPGIDGKETFLTLRQDELLRRIPVVLMSTNVRDPDLREMEHNGTTILQKPNNFSGYEEIAKTIIHLFN